MPYEIREVDSWPDGSPFAASFRDLINQMAELCSWVQSNKDFLDEVMARPWPLVSPVSATAQFLPAVITSNPPSPGNAIIWEYGWTSASPDPGGTLVVDPENPIGDSDEGETFALNLAEQLNFPDSTAAYGVDIVPVPPPADPTITADVLPIPVNQGIILFTLGQIPEDPPAPSIKRRYFIAENAINFVCSSP